MADIDEQQLDKIDIQSELKTLSPIEKKSIELRKQAETVEIKDKETYVDAKRIRRELVSHRTGTRGLRLTFTRKLDNLKDQFIKKEDEVLEASRQGENIIKDKIALYEEEERKRKEAEEQRIADIVQSLKDSISGLDRKKSMLEDVKRARAALKMERGLLDVSDRNKVAIKNVVAEVNESLDETEQFITDRIEQERVAEEQRVEREKLDVDRKELDEQKVISVAPKGTDEIPTGTILEPVTEENQFEKVIENDDNDPQDSELMEQREKYAATEIEKLANYLMTEWPEEILDGSAVDVAIVILKRYKETLDQEEK